MLDEDGRIVLMDFGAGAKMAQGETATSANISGTPIVMAPELFDGHDKTYAADVYSLGVLFFRLLANAYPIRGSSLRDLIRAHQAGEYQKLSHMRRGLPRGVVRLVSCMLRPDPRKRPEIAEVARQLGWLSQAPAR